jgi:putative selenate reductase
METRGLPELLKRIAGEYRAKGSIFEIPEKAFKAAFDLESGSPGLEIMGAKVSLPVGPAAGPHTQIAPNIVAAYLAGSRVFELKTVQENDSLDIEKPCIDAFDEGHNTEWSTELSLAQAREEYLRAWIAVQLLSSIFSSSPRDFIFNMSVGYTLAGIKGEKIDSFIEGMRDPAAAPASASFWEGALRDLDVFVGSARFAQAFGGEARAKARSLLSDFPSRPIHSVTLSTMHGCPPDEIERIGAYLIEEKGFDAFVKLNPTLLGYDEARRILDRTGWKDIEIRRDNFERDLQFADAVKLVSSLEKKARSRGRLFGIKLSNTLANANSGRFLPGNERYMSGRALFPLTVSLASRLALAVESEIPSWDSRFSYCGGAWARNAGELISAGLGPLTIATDILKPGGYLRILPASRAAVAALPGSPRRPDPAALERLAGEALERPEYRVLWKSGSASIKRSLPLVDCFAAPCIEACPVRQKVPEYIRLEAAGKTQEAFSLVLEDNPLPFITGTLCDHVCQAACSRNDYEGAVAIRDCKLAVARSGAKSASAPTRAPANNALFKGRVAILGAGPAGLSCAHHLALAGIPVTIFDKARKPGGVPTNVIPPFRIPREDIEADIERIRELGVEMRFGVDVKSLGELKAEGYSAFFVGSGAPLPREFKLEGDAVRVVDALTFLEKGSALGKSAFGNPKRVVVAGGGNTAMDAVRLALRLPGIEEVRLSYRRSREEMPADKEELENAIAEGGKLMELTMPESSSAGSDGSLLGLRVMELGERDASGRRSPKATDRVETVRCDLLVAAVGEAPDSSLFASLGIPVLADGRPNVDAQTQESGLDDVYVGGDASRGPASIISAVADGRRAAYAIMKKARIVPPESSYIPPAPDKDKLARRGEPVQGLDPAQGGFAAREADRCLECDSACLRCVEVCPNRANFALPIAEKGVFAQSLQIIHLDALCNECGNCGIFCPYEGEPYRGKPSLFRSRPARGASHNAGMSFGEGERPLLALRDKPDGEIVELPYAEWAQEGSGGRMGALARTVFRDHPYLLGGEL